MLFARLLSGYGRDASLNATERKAPGTVSHAQLPGSPTACSRSSRNGFEADGAVPPATAHRRCSNLQHIPSPSEHACPTNIADRLSLLYCPCAVADEDSGTPYSRRSDRSASEPGDVELMERQGQDSGAYGAAGAYVADRVRRRRRDGEPPPMHGGQHSSGAAGGVEAALTWLAEGMGLGAQQGPQQHQQQHHVNGARSSLHDSDAPPHRHAAAGNNAWKQLGAVISHGTLAAVQKIKRAASQPALATSSYSSFGDAADAVLTHKSSAGPGSGSGGAQGGSGGASGIDLLSRGLPPLPSARKDTKKE